MITVHFSNGPVLFEDHRLYEVCYKASGRKGRVAHLATKQIEKTGEATLGGLRIVQRRQ